ncbi:NAD(P)H-dependent oxidoreductase [Actinoplanes hulinensis]|uniref:NAD(P)H-dependent oxidoreductase n=1 Tax=Actinoplanes hulinensis TaxID=1144547 RepID=A0ABS7BH85_9ACTN|nr:NAD(P)H-dependent oxidoreductase [Actinoplanes hulinensis]MBW6440260.1 NAD(P)H-dependent oxidoreductase [Actinoplanes hulinensis]
MSNVVVISGHPSSGSSTLLLATAVGERISAACSDGTFALVDVAELGPGLLAPSDEATAMALLTVQGASLLIVATPAWRSTFSGALKVLLDRLPANALAGMLAVPVVTADIQSQADVAEAFLARLLSGLGADVVDFGLTAVGSELTELSTEAELYVAAILR